MDAFYASVELLRYPQLQGQPVVIGGPKSPRDIALLAHYKDHLHDIPLSAFVRLKDYIGRGVITTATYPARAFGIGSAMGLMKAAKLCPNAILLPVTFDLYRQYSQRFKDAVRKIAPLMEDRGVDEIYLDLSTLAQNHSDGGRALAEQLQRAVANSTGGLTCSIGIAPNKLLAKMASEFHKPQGISVLFEHDIAQQIWPLEVRKINGIGPKTEAKLRDHGIKSIGDLAHSPAEFLQQHFGRNYGLWLHQAALGQDDSPIHIDTSPVSMSRETTFERDLHAVQDRQILSQAFTALCQEIAKDLKRKGYKGKTIGVKVKYANFKTTTRDTTIDHYTADALEIRHHAGRCLKRLDLSLHLRLLGVRVGKLQSTLDEQAEQAERAAHTSDLFA